VCDEQIREIKLLLEVFEETDDLRLDAHVEGRNRFVEDQEVRLERERSCDPYPLPLSAGELVWVPKVVFVGETDCRQ